MIYNGYSLFERVYGCLYESYIPFSFRSDNLTVFSVLSDCSLGDFDEGVALCDDYLLGDLDLGFGVYHQFFYSFDLVDSVLLNKKKGIILSKYPFNKNFRLVRVKNKGFFTVRDSFFQSLSIGDGFHFSLLLLNSFLVKNN